MPESRGTYQTTDASGNAGALFTGGLQLEEGTVATLDPNKGVVWKRTNGTNGGYLYDTAISADQTVFSMRAEVIPGGSNPQATELGLRTDRNSLANSSVNIFPAGIGRTLLDGNLRSAFAQLGTGAAVKSMTGRVTITWNGVATQAVTAFQPGWGYANNESRYGVLLMNREIPGDITGFNFSLKAENWIPNDGIVVRQVSTGGAPPAGITHVDYMVWET